MARSAALSIVKVGKQWDLAPAMLQSLRHDKVALDQQLASHFMTCFGQLADMEAAEAIFMVRAVVPPPCCWPPPITLVPQQVVHIQAHITAGAAAGDRISGAAPAAHRQLPALGICTLGQVPLQIWRARYFAGLPWGPADMYIAPPNCTPATLAALVGMLR